MLNSDSLSRAKIGLVSISSPVNQQKIEKKLLDNMNLIDKTDDSFSKIIIDSLKKNRKINFSLNKHEEIYCNSTDDVKYLLKYLTFRYKFRLYRQVN